MGGHFVSACHDLNGPGNERARVSSADGAPPRLITQSGQRRHLTGGRELPPSWSGIESARHKCPETRRQWPLVSVMACRMVIARPPDVADHLSGPLPPSPWILASTRVQRSMTGQVAVGKAIEQASDGRRPTGKGPEQTNALNWRAGFALV